MRVFAILVGALVVGVSASAPASALEVGMGDQNPSMFADPRFQALGMERVRLVVPWDAPLRGGLDLERADAWLEAAQASGREAHVALTHSRVAPRSLPSQAEYQHAFALLRARYPWVRSYTPWNEANHPSQPTADRPDAVAGYYEAVRGGCPGCTVVAADVIDQRGFVAWVRELRAQLDHAPRVWGLHNYAEANRPEREGATASYLAAVPGEVWLTETGGIVSLVAASGRVSWPRDTTRAAESVGRAFRAALADPRVTRMYLYQWSVQSHERWDSAFVGPDGEERPSLTVLRDELAALRRPAGVAAGRPHGSVTGRPPAAGRTDSSEAVRVGEPNVPASPKEEPRP